jgi:hypothetical protein
VTLNGFSESAIFSLIRCHPELAKDLAQTGRAGVGQTLLAVGFDFVFDLEITIASDLRGATRNDPVQLEVNVKGGGQECPPHTHLNSEQSRR